ncbi:HyaD/HybD family hydrogenase maturation endopeptidase [Bacillus massilinigeriensis]|uniref:HyaD/HybD family hydrogenase maturation endopeptidase n=1 Tax=Bacillus mediterraneensis TaxID=1805474 RepID=UPI000A61F67D|nr:HyaD/HybD family hydrogenase maturation endopeptidase [Bacillus mediterraneensis]
MSESKRITILGIGNSIFQDEGIGVHALPILEHLFRDDPTVEIMEGATDGMKLLGPIEDAESLIVIDAINAGKEGGTIVSLYGDEIPAYYGIKMSIHQLGFQEVLLAAKLREKYPQHIVMHGMQPTSLELGVKLSETNQKSLPKLIDVIVFQVEKWRNGYYEQA